MELQQERYRIPDKKSILTKGIDCIFFGIPTYIHVTRICCYKTEEIKGWGGGGFAIMRLSKSLCLSAIRCVKLRQMAGVYLLGGSKEIESTLDILPPIKIILDKKLFVKNLSEVRKNESFPRCVYVLCM